MADNDWIDRKLFYSTIVFLIMLLSHQRATLHADVDGDGASVHREAMRALGSRVPAEHHCAAQRGLSNGALPLFDNSLRGRSSLAVPILSRLRGDHAVATREGTAARALLDIVFCYFGLPISE